MILEMSLSFQDRANAKFIYLGQKYGTKHFINKLFLVEQLIPIEPNLALSAHAVFSQSGHIRPEETAVSCPHFPN